MIIKINLRTKILTLSLTITTAKLADTSKMNSLLLGRNGRLLMPTLALPLMNIPVAEAKPNRPEGTMGIFAQVAVIFTSIAVGSGFAGTIVYEHKVLAGHPPVPSELETFRRLCESREWFEYIAWIARECPTTHPLEEGAAARALDLESQHFDESLPPQALLSRLSSCRFQLFSRLCRAAKNCSTTPTSDQESTNEKSRSERKVPSVAIVYNPKFQLPMGPNPRPPKMVVRMRPIALHPRPSLQAHPENRPPIGPIPRPPIRPAKARSSSLSPPYPKPTRLNHPIASKVLQDWQLLLAMLPCLL